MPKENAVKSSVWAPELLLGDILNTNACFLAGRPGLGLDSHVPDGGGANERPHGRGGAPGAAAL